MIKGNICKINVFKLLIKYILVFVTNLAKLFRIKFKNLSITYDKKKRKNNFDHF